MLQRSHHTTDLMQEINWGWEQGAKCCLRTCEGGRETDRESQRETDRDSEIGTDRTIGRELAFMGVITCS